MRTLRLIRLALGYHWDAHKSNPANLLAGTLGMLVNNLIVLWGLWAMLFDGKPDGRRMTVYFLALNAMVTIGWGSICFFLGGVRLLGRYVEDGALEPMLSTPRDPLLIAGISHSMIPALGDMLQGSCGLLVLFWIAPLGMALRAIVFTLVTATAFLGLFILAGSVPLYVRRGGALAELLLECNLSLSFYPMGRVFEGRGRALLYLTPAAIAGVLPAGAVESGSFAEAGISAVAALVFLALSAKVFRFGLRRYQPASYVAVSR